MKIPSYSKASISFCHTETANLPENQEKNAPRRQIACPPVLCMCETAAACWPCPNSAHSPTTTVVTTAFCRRRVQSLTMGSLQTSNSCSLLGQERCFRNPNSSQGSWGGALSLSPTKSAAELRELRCIFWNDHERQHSHPEGQTQDFTAVLLHDLTTMHTWQREAEK